MLINGVPAPEQRIRQEQYEAFKAMLRNPTTCLTWWQQANELAKLYFEGSDLNGIRREEVHEMLVWHRKRNSKAGRLIYLFIVIFVAMAILLSVQWSKKCDS